MRSLVPDGLGPGARVGSWLIEAQLSTSGSGTVYRAQHTRTRRRAAVKVLHAELAGSREASARFAREVRATQHARHPGLMRVFGAGSLPDGRPWFAMELVEGRDLSAILRERGALSPAEALAILEPLAAALTVAHARGIVHRDVKAASVLVCDDDDTGPRVVLLDCGVARFLGAADAGAAAFAPEQTAGATVDARADVYGLGVLLFQMLTGELPFADASPAIMRQLHRWARRPNPSSHAPLAAEIDAVVMRAMARDPDQRHESVEALVRELRAALVAAAAADPDGRPTEAARAASGVAVHLELHGAQAVLAGDDIDDGLADALHAMLPRAVEHFGAHGFVAAIQMGHAAVLLRPAIGAAPSRSERAEALAVARACVAEAVRAAPTAGTRRPRLRCYLDVRAAELANGRVVGGPVLRLAEWVPDDDTPGVHGSSRALADLEPPPGGL
jgi:eukaryotic-like serine/threonine-protein kinase